MAATIDVALRQAGADTACMPATFTRSDFEAEILRLESMNFNLKIRVSQLEEALDDEPRLHAAPPAVALGKDGEEEVEGAVVSHSSIGGAWREAAEERRAALDAEWAAVQKLHNEVATLKMDLEMGKLPAEPAARRRAFLAKHTALSDKLQRLTSEIAAQRQNSIEARRQQEMAEGRAALAEAALHQARQHTHELEASITQLQRQLHEAATQTASAEHPGLRLPL